MYVTNPINEPPPKEYLGLVPLNEILLSVTNPAFDDKLLELVNKVVDVAFKLLIDKVELVDKLLRLELILNTNPDVVILIFPSTFNLL